MIKADARSSNGTPLFKNPCPDCGKPRLSDRRRIGTSCLACSLKVRNYKHGFSKHPLYKKLVGMIIRCEYPSSDNWDYYGGAGVYICDEWRKNPESFVEWALANGYEKGLEIDRKDYKGPYSPENCQFVTHKVNSRTRRNSRCTADKANEIKLLLKNSVSVKDAAKKCGVPYMVAWHINKGNTWRDD